MSIYRTRFLPPLPDRAALCRAIVALHRRQTYVRGNNFLLEAPEFASTCATLYTAFENQARHLLGRFTIAPDSVPACWAYVSNRTDYRGGVHHHLQSSTINGVYYLQMPAVAPDAEHTGALQFFDADAQPSMQLQPRQDDLLIFPNYLLHEPKRIDSDDYRIAINMEIRCDYRWLLQGC